MSANVIQSAQPSVPRYVPFRSPAARQCSIVPFPVRSRDLGAAYGSVMMTDRERLECARLELT
jgi:hypothetical protein